MDNFSISILDLLLLVVTITWGFRNLYKGIVRSIFSLLGISASYLAASLYHQPVTERLSGVLGNPSWIYLAGFSVLFLAVLVVFVFLDGALRWLDQSKDAKSLSAQGLPGLLSFFIGLAEGFLFCSVILWVLQSRDLPSSKIIFQNSIFAPYYLHYNPLLFGLEKRLSPTNLF